MDSETLYAQAMAHIEAGEHEDAQRLLTRMIQANPADEKALLALALIIPQMDQAIAFLNRILDMDPANASARDYLRLARKEKRRDLATAAPESAAADEETPLPRLGRYLLQAGSVSSAQMQAALAGQRQADALGQTRRLGEILIQQGAVTEAQLDAAIQKQIADFKRVFED